MENQQERTLGYNLATKLTYEDIKEVSGGAGKANAVSQHYCLVPTGNNPQHMDGTVDVSIDW